MEIGVKYQIVSRFLYGGQNWNVSIEKYINRKRIGVCYFLSFSNLNTINKKELLLLFATKVSGAVLLISSTEREREDERERRRERMRKRERDARRDGSGAINTQQHESRDRTRTTNQKGDVNKPPPRSLSFVYTQLATKQHQLTDDPADVDRLFLRSHTVHSISCCHSCLAF